MRSNWEIHGGVPCRAWQAAGIGMGEGRERHSLHRHSPAACCCITCTSGRVTCPWQTIPSLAMCVCRWEPTHPVSDPVSNPCPEPLLGQLKAGFTPSSPKGEPGHHITLGKGKQFHLLAYLCPSGHAFWTNSWALECPTKPWPCCWVWKFVLQFESKRKEGNLKVFCYKHRCRW